MNEAQLAGLDSTEPRPIDRSLVEDTNQITPDSSETTTDTLSENNRQEQAREDQTPTKSAFVEGGSPREEIDLDPEAEQAIRDRFVQRAEVARELQRKERKLSDIDKMVLREGFVDRIKSGKLTKEDIALGWYMINSDLIETQVATAKLISTNDSRRGRYQDLPMLSRLAADPRISTVDFIVPGTGETISEYSTRIGINTWPDEDIINRLNDLQKLQHRLESSFYKNGTRRPYTDRARMYMLGSISSESSRSDVRDTGTADLLPGPTGLTSADKSITEKSGLKLNDEMIDQANKIIEERIRNGTYAPGTELIQLAQQNPVEYLRITNEANHNALTEKARNGALEILNEEGKSADEGAIRKRAEELSQAPKPEEIEPLEAAKTEAERVLTEAEEALGKLKVDLATAEQDARSAGASYEKAKKEAEIANDTIPERINKIQGNIDNLSAGLVDVAKNGTSPGAGKGGGKQPSSSESIRQTINGLEDRIAKYEKELRDTLIKQASAEVDRNSANNHLDRLRGTETDPGPPPKYTGGEVKAAQTKVTGAKTKVKNTEEALFEKQKEIEMGGSQERKDQSTSLSRWAMVSERRARVHEELYSQEHGTEFTIKNLSDHSITQEGEVAGVEQVRKLIFQTIDKEGFTPEMAKLTRGMISDESFARAMIEHFEIDSRARLRPDQPKTYGEALQEIDDLREDSVDESKTQTERDQAKNNLKTKQQSLARFAAWNMTNMTRSQIGSFVNFMIERGLTQAELGNPNMTMVK